MQKGSYKRKACAFTASLPYVQNYNANIEDK